MELGVNCHDYIRFFTGISKGKAKQVKRVKDENRVENDVRCRIINTFHLKQSKKNSYDSVGSYGQLTNFPRNSIHRRFAKISGNMYILSILFMV